MNIFSMLFGGGLGGKSPVQQIVEGVEDVSDIFQPSRRERHVAADAQAQAMRYNAQTNMAEARHRSVFVAGWRPSVGWICSIAMGYHFLLHPMLAGAVMKYAGIELFQADWQSLSVVLMGMLGMGGLRSFEKNKGLTS